MGKSLLKVLLSLYICVYYRYTFTQRWACLCVNESAQMQSCSQHCVSRGIVSPLRTNSNTSRIYCALLVLSTKVLWVCPDLILPLEQRTAMADPAQCPLSCLGTFVFLARWDQQPPPSAPRWPFSTGFTLWLKHRRRSITVILNLFPPKSFLVKPREMSLKLTLCLSFFNNRTNKSHS